MKFEEKHYMYSVNRGSSLRKLEQDKRKLVSVFILNIFSIVMRQAIMDSYLQEININITWYKES
jgi:hypothetical protein